MAGKIIVLWACIFLAAADDSRCFPPAGRLSLKPLPAPLLKNAALPAGLVADYGAYQMFLVRTADTQKAAFLLLDYKKTLTDAHYLPNMGGFAGSDGGRPAYVFAKGVFLAGVMGLAPERADPVARVFAARIPLK